MLNERDPAPEFRLPAQDGREVALSALRGKNVVLYFYPKAMTPGCTTESSEFRDAKPRFDKAGAVILGCSADSVDAYQQYLRGYPQGPHAPDATTAVANLNLAATPTVEATMPPEAKAVPAAKAAPATRAAPATKAAAAGNAAPARKAAPAQSYTSSSTN